MPQLSITCVVNAAANRALLASGSAKPKPIGLVMFLHLSQTNPAFLAIEVGLYPYDHKDSDLKSLASMTAVYPSKTNMPWSLSQ